MNQLAKQNNLAKKKIPSFEVMATEWGVFPEFCEKISGYNPVKAMSKYRKETKPDRKYGKKARNPFDSPDKHRTDRKRVDFGGEGKPPDIPVVSAGADPMNLMGEEAVLDLTRLDHLTHPSPGKTRPPGM
jgi:hypothetical protein